MSIAEATTYCREQLQKIYEPGEAATIADWLIEYITGNKKEERISTKNILLMEDQLQLKKKLLQRLLQHEPIQYVLNEAWFSGMKFYVDSNVLIPRAETEELVEWIITDCKFPVDALSILDIGTGSGCIPIAIKRRIRKAMVTGCDVNKDAIAVAQKNAVALGADIQLVQLDFLNEQQWSHLLSYDIIVSNPPYVPLKDKGAMQANVVNYEPHTALFVPDNDALIFYKAIALFAKQHLKTGGIIYCEIHEGLSDEVRNVFQTNGFITSVKKDMQGKDRMIKAVSSSPSS